MNEEQELNELFGNEPEVYRSLSYSRLSDFDRNGPKVLIKRTRIDNYGAKIGSIVDDLVTPKKGFNFKDKYIISNCKKPTATLGKLTDIILKNYREIPNDQELLNICDRNNFWSTSKADTLIKKFDNTDFRQYLKDHIKSNKKIVITNEDYFKSKKLAEVLKTHKHSKEYFDNDDYEIIYQYNLEFEYKDIIFRGKIDILIIDHKNKAIRIVDLKTGKSDFDNFKRSFIKFRYYLQEAVYTKGFKQICKDLNLKNYKLLPFQFLYIGRSEKLPMIFGITNKWHKAAQNGFNLNGYKYRGLDELIKEVKWHFKNNQFDLDRKAYESNGHIQIEDNIIELNK